MNSTLGNSIIHLYLSVHIHVQEAVILGMVLFIIGIAYVEYKTIISYWHTYCLSHIGYIHPGL